MSKKTKLAKAVTTAIEEYASSVQPITTLESTADTGKRVTAFNLVAAQPWAIVPDWLETISAIARRENESRETVEARLGRPLQNSRTVTMRGDVAVIPVTGPIFRYANIFTDISGAVSLDTLAIDFTHADEDPAVSSIVLNFDSPGGMAAGIAEFAQIVNNASKPVIAYVDNMAASAAYWIAAAANEIVLSKTGEVGSVGAVVGIDTKKSEDMIEIVSSQSPDKRPDVSTDAGRQQIQTRIDAIAQVFVEDVADYRGVSVETVLTDFGRGGMRMGKEAVGLKMADRISTLEEVIAGLSGSTRGGSHTMATDTGAPAAKKPVITRKYLTEHHPDIVKAIEDDAATLACEEGATAERQRIQEVFARSTPGHDDLINTLAFDGKTTGVEAGDAVLQADKASKSKVLDNLKSDGKQVSKVPASRSDDAGDINSNLPLEERCKAEWDTSAELQDEFGGNFKAYHAFKKNESNGRAHIYKGGK